MVWSLGVRLRSWAEVVFIKEDRGEVSCGVGVWGWSIVVGSGVGLSLVITLGYVKYPTNPNIVPKIIIIGKACLGEIEMLGSGIEGILILDLG